MDRYNCRPRPVNTCYRGQIQCLPPSTGICAPVIKDESSDARKAIVLATSDTSPGLPRACVVFVLSKN